MTSPPAGSRSSAAGGTETTEESIFDYLEREMARLRLPADDLPFDFACGFVGYLGYELKADCGGERAHAAPLPDAQLLLADRLIAFDHLERHTYLLALAEPGAPTQAEAWIEATRQRLAALRPLPEPAADPVEPVEFGLRRSHDHYLADIAVCRAASGRRRELRGLPDQPDRGRGRGRAARALPAPAPPQPQPLRRLPALRRRGGAELLAGALPAHRPPTARSRRSRSRAPAAAVADPAEDARLAAELRADEKNRAENLMIVDLLRNDLGSVCEVGSVAVPHLMEVESYDTVHQLVSTVRGRLRADSSPAACIRACFPGGSMTGAPKVRTMEIVDELEGAARGVYSGAIGYLGLGGGCDLSIAIRTIVLDGAGATIGIGGAIVAQSQAEDEYQESLLKGLAPMKAIDPHADPRALSGAP